MSNEYFDWPARPTPDRFAPFDTARSGEVNEAFDLASGGFEKLPTPAQVWGSVQNYGVAGGAVDAWTVSVAPMFITSYGDGLTVKVKFPQANTIAGATLNLNGMGAKPIVAEGGDPIAAGDIAAGAILDLVYNATTGKFQIWLGNNSAGSILVAANAAAAAAAASAAAAGAVVLGNFLQAGTGAKQRTFTSKARDSVSIYDFGADGSAGNTALLSSRYASLAQAQVDYPFATALTQSIDWAAYRAAHDYIRSLGKRGEIGLDKGDFYFTDPLRITNALNLIGEGGGEFFTLAATRLRFATNIDGIRIHSVLSGDTPDPGKSGTKSLIRDLTLYCPAPGISGHGINATATCYIEGVDVQGFPENGIRIFGSAAGLTGSANLWAIKNSRANNCGLAGLLVSGPDTNAGSAVNFDGSNCGTWGILDSSLLGNTYVACHANNNGVGSYKTTGTVADNVFIGCYTEGAANYGTEFVQPTHVYGGVLNGEQNYPFISITGDGTGAQGKAIVNGAGVITGIYLKARGTGYTTATATITKHGSGSGGVLGAVTIAGGKCTAVAITSGGTGYVGNKKFSYLKNNGAIGGYVTSGMEIAKDGTSARGGYTRFSPSADVHMLLQQDGENKYELLWNESQGTYELQFAAAKRVLAFGGNLSTQTGGRSAAVTDGSYIGFPGGFWNGSTSNARYRGVVLSLPTSGEYARGDALESMSPAAAGTPGWACTTGGIAGSTAVFKARAAVAA